MSDHTPTLASHPEDNGLYSDDLTGTDNPDGERDEPGFDDADTLAEESGEDKPETTTGDPTTGPGGKIEPRKGANQDADEQDPINAAGPAGQSADPFVGKIISGQPVGGPHDLGEKAANDGENNG